MNAHPIPSEDRRIPVGISACLLGHPVRHDGGHKHSRYCTEVLGRYFCFHCLYPDALGLRNRL